MKIHIIITTYNRSEMLKALLEDINKCGLDYSISVWDDGSDITHSYQNLLELDGFNASYYRNDINGGKKKYYELVNKAFALRPQATYYFMLPDDVRLMDGFFQKAINIFESIRDANKVCVNLDIDGRLGKDCWTGFKPIDKGAYFHSQWVDCCFIANERFFQQVGKIVVGDRWRHNELLGSGVGMVISQTLHRNRLNMYHIKTPLLTHGDHPSVMNPNQKGTYNENKPYVPK